VWTRRPQPNRGASPTMLVFSWGRSPPRFSAASRHRTIHATEMTRHFSWNRQCQGVQNATSIGLSHVAPKRSTFDYSVGIVIESYHVPSLGMEAQGSAGSRASPL